MRVFMSKMLEELFKEETDEKTENLIETFEKAGGEVDYVFLSIKKTGINDRYLLSRKAVVHAMEILAGRLDEQYLFHLKLSKEERNKLFKIVIHNREPAGKVISLAEFFGPFFDTEKNMLLFAGITEQYTHYYYYPGQVENKENSMSVDIQPFRKLYTYHTIGYAGAFTAPPYNLKMNKTEINELFVAFNDILFNGETPYIVLWENDWSNYFDKGKSWWGGYMWSLLFEQSNRCVVIGASAID